MHRLCLAILAVLATPLVPALALEGTLVRNGDEIGVRLKASGEVVPLKHVEGLYTLSKRVLHQLAKVPSGTYVKVEPVKLGVYDDRRSRFAKAQADGSLIPSQVSSMKSMEFEVQVSPKGTRVKSELGTLRLHTRSFFADGTASGYHPSTRQEREAFLAQFTRQQVHAEFFALHDEQGNPTDLFLSGVRARVTEDASFEDGTVVPAGAEVWISEALDENGRQRVTYRHGHTQQGGVLPERVLDTDPRAFDPPAQTTRNGGATQGKGGATRGLVGGLPVLR